MRSINGKDIVVTIVVLSFAFIGLPVLLFILSSARTNNFQKEIEQTVTIFLSNPELDAKTIAQSVLDSTPTSTQGIHLFCKRIFEELQKKNSGYHSIGCGVIVNKNGKYIGATEYGLYDLNGLFDWELTDIKNFSRNSLMPAIKIRHDSNTFQTYILLQDRPFLGWHLQVYLADS